MDHNTRGYHEEFKALLALVDNIRGKYDKELGLITI